MSGEAVDEPNYKRIKLFDTLEIIKKLDDGASKSAVATEYGVAGSTIYDIYQKRECNLKYAKVIYIVEDSLEKTRINNQEQKPVERALWKWEKRGVGEPVTGCLLSHKALIFNEKLHGPSTFKASNSWLQGFKKRHGIRALAIQGERLSSDFESAEDFREEFVKEMLEKAYTLEFIYNTDESGLIWKLLPSRTFASQSENSEPGQKSLERPSNNNVMC